jgi:hypothetical protein
VRRDPRVPRKEIAQWTCYPLGVAAHLAIACDCILRGDFEGAQAALARPTALARDDRLALASATPAARRPALQP